ncbi:YibE/F family protein [Vagococcus zengguangii]|uniref:YibE/F family protein n=1 Tax=Vagococcus zengguangii TaxID=2571750 RepID=A0A4D7CV14_9ENTE|nr:YibE/F family protein [Vagococcus zengguangii]QCI87263.1 YibE/F family protein [Vagococcus zengguangii]TLG80767.1 YibE/F family protein [Vagococcus zengguangii]
MSAVSLMAMILSVVVLMVGGKKGLFTLLNLAFNLMSIILVIWALSKGFSLGLVVAIFTIVTFFNNFWLFNQEIDAYYTKVSMTASAGVILIMTCLLPVFLRASASYGFAPEELEELGAFSLDVLVNYRDIFAVLVIVAMVGAVIDGAISVASAMSEIESEHPDMTVAQLRQSGLRIGRDIVSTTMTTLLLAFFGNYLGVVLFILDFNYGWQYLMNAQLVVSQLVVMFLAAIGTLVTLPLTAYLYIKMKQSPKSKVGGIE